MAAPDGYTSIDLETLVGTVDLPCESLNHPVHGTGPAIGIMWQNRGADGCITRPQLLLCEGCYDYVTHPDAPTFPCRACGVPIVAATYMARWERL